MQLSLITPRKSISAVNATVLLIALTAAPVRAHEASSGWRYPNECCSDDQDCQAIPARDVSQDSDGYIVTLKPGEHRHVPEGGTFYMLDNQIKPSGDEFYHVCIHVYSNGLGALCLFIPVDELSSWEPPDGFGDMGFANNGGRA